MADPITIGSLTDVPAPNSPINAQFHQEVAHRIVQRFASKSALDAWVAEPGAVAWVNTSPPVLWLRSSAGWCRQTPWGKTVIGTAVQTIPAEPVNTVFASVTIPTDPGPRVALFSAHVVPILNPNVDTTLEVVAAGVMQAQWIIPTAGANVGLARQCPVALAGRLDVAAGATITVQTRITSATRNNIVTIPANLIANRLDVTVTPDGGVIP